MKIEPFETWDRRGRRGDVALRITHTPEELAACREIAARKRHLVEIGAIRHRASYAHRTAAEQIAQDFAGACGELAVARLLLYDVGPMFLEAFARVRAVGAGDGGADLSIDGVRVQVKTAAPAREADLALWLPPHFVPASCDVVVLAWRSAGGPEAETVAYGWTLAEHVALKGRTVETKHGPGFNVAARLLSAASWLDVMVATLRTSLLPA